MALLRLRKNQPKGYAHTSALSILSGSSGGFFHFDRSDSDTRWCSQRNESPAPPFIIEDVLQDTSTAPYPCNHAPLSMKKDDILVKEFHDMTSVYCYNFRDESLSAETTVNSSSDEGACVKHIFTGPYENLKVQATRLFLQIQEGIELSWQGVATGIAEGISTCLIHCFCLTALPCTLRFADSI